MGGNDQLVAKGALTPLPPTERPRTEYCAYSCMGSTSTAATARARTIPPAKRPDFLSMMPAGARSRRSLITAYAAYRPISMAV